MVSVASAVRAALPEEGLVVADMTQVGYWSRAAFPVYEPRTLIGRAMVYGLGAMGQEGVAKAIDIIHKELDITMAFCGHTQIDRVNRDILLPGTYPTA